MSIRKIEKFFLGATLFSIPLGTGAFFDGVMSADLVLLVDVWMACLYTVWLYRTAFLTRVQVKAGSLAMVGLAMIIWSFFSLTSAIAMRATGVGIFFAFKTLALYFYLVHNIRSRKDLLFVINMLMVALLFQGVLATLQKAMGRSLGLGFLGEQQVSMHKMDSRARGTLGYPNRYGAVLILLLPLAISMTMFVRRSGYKLFLALVSAFGIMGLFLSLSRSSWAGFLFAMFILTLLLFRAGRLKPKYFAGIAVVLVAAGAIAYLNWDTILYRFEHGADGRFRSRMLDISYPIIMSHPVLGVGLNNYQWHSYDSFNFWHPVHNEFLRFAAELGFPGALMFAALLFVFLKEAYRNIIIKDTLLNAIAIGAFCGVVAFIVAINIGPEYQHYRIQLVFWALGGITFALRKVRFFEVQMMKRQQFVQEQRARMDAAIAKASLEQQSSEPQIDLLLPEQRTPRI